MTPSRPKRKKTTAASDAPKRRAFRPPSEYLAIEPRALDFSYLMTGVGGNDRTEDGIAIVTINGPLEHHADANGWFDSYESILQRVEAAMTGEDACWMEALFDPESEPSPPIPAKAVVLRIDSPGGEAAGATYAHRQLRKLSRKYKIPLYAYANEMAASAAYELACAADEIWLPDTGTVGSIGVIATLYDRTKMHERTGFHIELVTSGEFKADNHADRELTPEVRTRIQARVDKLANVFWGVVAKARGTTPKAVASLNAGVFIGQDAVDAGIADGVAGFDAFLRYVASSLNASTDFDASATAA